MAAVGSGASGVLEHAGGVGPAGAGECQRPPRGFPREATHLMLLSVLFACGENPPYCICSVIIKHL